MLENKDCVMFKDMTVKEQGIIIQALKDGLEVDHCYAKDTGWFNVICKRIIHLDHAYRVVPKRLNIPWGSVRGDLCYAVMMKDKRVWLSSEQPLWRNDIDEWYISSDSTSVVMEASCLAVDTNGIDFRTSLVSRFD